MAYEPKVLKQLGVFQRGNGKAEKILVELVEVSGTPKVSVRVFYQADDEKWYPGRQGINLTMGEWGQIVGCDKEIPADAKKPQKKGNAVTVTKTGGRDL